MSKTRNRLLEDSGAPTNNPVAKWMNRLHRPKTIKPKKRELEDKEARKEIEDAMLESNYGNRD